MQIETVIVDRDDERLPFEVAREDHSSGFACIGSGMYAQVYTRSNVEHVVKIFKANDVGYLAYIETLAQLGPVHGYTPNITRIINYRMNPFTSNDPEQETCQHNLDCYVVYMEQLTEDDNKTWHRRIRFTGLLKRYLSRIEDGEFNWNSVRPVHRDLLALLEIARERAGLKFFDLHVGNVLMRNGRFVITDPLG